MILLRLSDGLGNQLFQYAAGETLRMRTGARIRYLVDAFASSRARSDRPLLLPRFVACEDDLMGDRDPRALLGMLAHRALRGAKGPVSHVSRLWHVARSAGHTPQYDTITDGMLVTGYFQSRHCVEASLPIVREAIGERFGPKIEAARSQLRARFGDRRLLALHLRLGDYLTIGSNREAVVPLDRVKAVLSAASIDAQVLLFTDSPEMVGELGIARDLATLASADPLDDFANMAACDDFVIANSTFSWWASTLGTSPGKQVWAPRNWHRPGRETIAHPTPREEIHLSDHLLY
jgi:hypothetical protein